MCLRFWNKWATRFGPFWNRLKKTMISLAFEKYWLVTVILITGFVALMFTHNFFREPLTCYAQTHPNHRTEVFCFTNNTIKRVWYMDVGRHFHRDEIEDLLPMLDGLKVKNISAYKYEENDDVAKDPPSNNLAAIPVLFGLQVFLALWWYLCRIPFNKLMFDLLEMYNQLPIDKPTSPLQYRTIVEFQKKLLNQLYLKRIQWSYKMLYCTGFEGLCLMLASFYLFLVPLFVALSYFQTSPVKVFHLLDMKEGILSNVFFDDSQHFVDAPFMMAQLWPCTIQNLPGTEPFHHHSFQEECLVPPEYVNGIFLYLLMWILFAITCLNAATIFIRIRLISPLHKALFEQLHKIEPPTRNTNLFISDLNTVMQLRNLMVTFRSFKNYYGRDEDNGKPFKELHRRAMQLVAAKQYEDVYGSPNVTSVAASSVQMENVATNDRRYSRCSTQTQATIEIHLPCQYWDYHLLPVLDPICGRRNDGHFRRQSLRTENEIEIQPLNDTPADHESSGSVSEVVATLFEPKTVSIQVEHMNGTVQEDEEDAVQDTAV